MYEYVSFSDETCTTGHDYMVIGGVLCRDDMAAHLITEIDRIHPERPADWTYEWKYVRPANMKRYRRFVELFFEYNKEHHIDFRCLVIDCRKLNHAKFNKGDGETGFQKFLYQHFFSHFRAYEGLAHLRCYHHRRDSRYDLADIRVMINGQAFREIPRIIDPFKEIAYKTFAEKPALQFADVC